jgi:hypothetical protein
LSRDICSKQQNLIEEAILGPKDSIDTFSHFIDRATRHQVNKMSYKLLDIFEVDVLKDVAACSWTQFAARLFHLSIRSTHNSRAAFNDKQLFDKMMAIFQFVHLNNNPVKASALRRDALTASRELTKEVQDGCAAIMRSSIARVSHTRGAHGKHSILPDHGINVLQRLFDSGAMVEEVVSLVMILSVDLVVCSTFAVSA